MHQTSQLAILLLSITLSSLASAQPGQSSDQQKNVENHIDNTASSITIDDFIESNDMQNTEPHSNTKVLSRITVDDFIDYSDETTTDVAWEF